MWQTSWTRKTKVSEKACNRSFKQEKYPNFFVEKVGKIYQAFRPSYTEVPLWFYDTSNFQKSLCAFVMFVIILSHYILMFTNTPVPCF